MAIMQAGNLYVFTVNNPVLWVDPSGRLVITATVSGAISAATFATALASELLRDPNFNRVFFKSTQCSKYKT